MSPTGTERRRLVRIASVATAGVALVAAAVTIPAIAAGSAGRQAVRTVSGPAAGHPGAGGPVSGFAPSTRSGYGSRGDLFALTDDGQLYRLDRSGRIRPGSRVTVTGLAAGERLVGIDTRPANGQLYGVGSTSRLYVIDPATGAAAPVGQPFSTPLAGTQFGVDFNPTVDRLRIVSDTGQNLRIEPTTGTVAGVDTALSIAGGGPVRVTAAAYTNSVAGAPVTALYDIDTGTDTLLLQGTKPGVTPLVSPNTGQLFPVGRLGLDVTGATGFEIVGAARSAAFAERDYTALAAVQLNGAPSSVLVGIDLRTGSASVQAQLTGRVVGLAASPGAPTTAYATTAANELVQLDLRTLRSVSRRPITGLQPGETALGIDVRPANGQLYLLGSTNQIYVVNPATAAATPVGAAFTPSVSGSLVGFDVNPVVDRLRVVTTAGQNLRINPDTGAVVGVDTALAYAPDDRNAPLRPNAAHAAYTNNRVGATSTTLHGIDAGLGVLVTQQPPNDGTLRTVGSLRVSGVGRGGFDIAADGAAIAALTPSGSVRTRIYSINLTTGRARVLARFDGPVLTGLAVAPRGVTPRS